MGIQITDIYRAMVVFPHKSNIPRNNMVNTFHFRNDDPVGSTESMVNKIFDLLVRFYGTNGTGISAGFNIMSRITLNYLRPQLRVYDLGKPEPREPVIREWATGLANAPGATAAQALPEEVAACISWSTSVIPPKIGKKGIRGRGRTYIGGLATGSAETPAGTGLVQLQPAFRHLLATKAHELAAASTGVIHHEEPQLVVLSPTYARADEVNRGWVDNRFDTQRRRGADPDVRTTFKVGEGVVHPA